jgi:hypothetical protein
MLLLDSVLLVVVYALMDTSVASCAIHILELCLLIILQDSIATLTEERVESVEEEGCIKIESEEDYIQLVCTVKTEEEVSVVCWCVLC